MRVALRKFKPKPPTSLDVIYEASPVTSLAASVVISTDLSIDTYGGTKEMEMIWVEPGTFTMGHAGMYEEREVTLTKGFYLGKYEVTRAQYEAVMTGNTDGLNATPSSWANNPDRLCIVE